MVCVDICSYQSLNTLLPSFLPSFLPSAHEVATNVSRCLAICPLLVAVIMSRTLSLSPLESLPLLLPFSLMLILLSTEVVSGRRKIASQRQFISAKNKEGGGGTENVPLMQEVKFPTRLEDMRMSEQELTRSYVHPAILYYASQEDESQYLKDQELEAGRDQVPATVIV